MTIMTDKEFLEKLNAYPELKNRFKEILSISSNSDKKQITLVDEAEMEIIARVRQLGLQTIQMWADTEMARITFNTKRQIPGARKHVKKNSGGTTPTEK